MRPFSKLIFILAFCIFLPVFSQPLPDLPEKQFGQPLNTQNDEYNPIVSPDGRYIVFQSNRQAEKEEWTFGFPRTFAF